ncbi:hypothetical protein Psi02_38300 [Planotetraspora silvatica]|uniref:Uncharacterized protein n=2 Tax=Planotetraspora silvatica TaxID=234614 RepID=A0A8J3XPH0_9ACTN|nr:hypothetical protein Psi02_38300 [Planotetraspora silvatica]
MLFVALVSVGIIVMVIFVRDVFAWERCGQDTGTAVADVEMYGAPSPAQCSTAKTEPTDFQPGFVVSTRAAAINTNTHVAGHTPAGHHEPSRATPDVPHR